MAGETNKHLEWEFREFDRNSPVRRRDIEALIGEVAGLEATIQAESSKERENAAEGLATVVLVLRSINIKLGALLAVLGLLAAILILR